MFALLLAVVLPATAAEIPGKTESLAEVEGEAITSGEVEQALGARFPTLDEQIYTLKRQQLEALIAERLLAREAGKRGLSAEALIEAKVTARVGLVSEQEIESFYQANKSPIQDQPEENQGGPLPKKSDG